jgi:hypothetical protein
LAAVAQFVVAPECGDHLLAHLFALAAALDNLQIDASRDIVNLAMG